MFDFGLSEFILIGVLFILVIKPEDLPKVFRWMGRQYHKLQQLKTRLMREINLMDLD